MSHAETCPICWGKGKLKNNDQYTASEDKICYGCDGKGWISITDDEKYDLWTPNPFLVKRSGD